MANFLEETGIPQAGDASNVAPTEIREVMISEEELEIGDSADPVTYDDDFESNAQVNEPSEKLDESSEREEQPVGRSDEIEDKVSPSIAKRNSIKVKGFSHERTPSFAERQFSFKDIEKKPVNMPPVQKPSFSSEPTVVKSQGWFESVFFCCAKGSQDK